MSKYIWKLKRQEKDYSIKWSTRCLASPYSRETKKSQLCTMEKKKGVVDLLCKEVRTLEKK